MPPKTKASTASKTPKAARCSPALLLALPEDLLAYLLMEWVDPLRDLRVLSRVLGFAAFQRIVTRPGFVLRPGRVLPPPLVTWLTKQRKIRVQWWESTGTFAHNFATMRWDWYQNGQLHRDGDLPALVCADGTQKWFQNGRLHRDGDLPAVVRTDGLQEWYQHGLRHRDGDLPARIDPNGSQEWHQRGQRHRDGDRPAVVWKDGSQHWFKHGRRHRGGGLPAAVHTNPVPPWQMPEEWWTHGVPRKKPLKAPRRRNR